MLQFVFCCFKNIFFLVVLHYKVISLTLCGSLSWFQYQYLTFYWCTLLYYVRSCQPWVLRNSKHKLQRLSFLQQLMKLFKSHCFISHTAALHQHTDVPQKKWFSGSFGLMVNNCRLCFSRVCCCHGYIRSNPHRERVQKKAMRNCEVSWILSLFRTVFGLSLFWEISLSWVVSVCSPHKAHNGSAVKADVLTACL